MLTNSPRMEMSTDQFLHCPPLPSMAMDRRWRANVDPAPNCPRCASSNTKFCYYNNYSLSQPRFFCKGCRRYWTKGGSLRSVPVGGGCRKSRRSRSAKALSSSSSVINTSPNSSSDCSQESGGPDIDMAAVFAKFLNHNLDMTVSNTTSSEASHNSFTSSSCEMENGHNGFDSEMFSDDFLEVPDHNLLQKEDAIHGFINPDLTAFDDIIEDIFWSDDSNISNMTFQPAVQSREFDSTLLHVDQYESQQISSPLIIGVTSTTQDSKYFQDHERQTVND